MVTKTTSRLKKKAKQKTSWAGLLTIVAAVMTGGASALTDPALLAQVGAGLALVLAPEPEEDV